MGVGQLHLGQDFLPRGSFHFKIYSYVVFKKLVQKCRLATNLSSR